MIILLTSKPDGFVVVTRTIKIGVMANALPHCKQKKAEQYFCIHPKTWIECLRAIGECLEMKLALLFSRKKIQFSVQRWHSLKKGVFDYGNVIQEMVYLILLILLYSFARYTVVQLFDYLHKSVSGKANQSKACGA